LNDCGKFEKYKYSIIESYRDHECILIGGCHFYMNEKKEIIDKKEGREDLVVGLNMDDFENKFNEFVKSPKLNGLNHVMTFESFLRDKYSIDIM